MNPPVIPLIPLDPLDLSRSATRREFCAHACQAASLLAVAALTGCGGGDNPASPSPGGGSSTPLTSVASTVSGRAISVSVDVASPLGAIGSAVIVQTSLGSFLVAHPAVDTFTALTAVCTHEGCTVNGFANSRFVCPCHGSQYTTAGAVVMGPAPRALQQFPAVVSNGMLTFSV